MTSISSKPFDQIQIRKTVNSNSKSVIALNNNEVKGISRYLSSYPTKQSKVKDRGLVPWWHSNDQVNLRIFVKFLKSFSSEQNVPDLLVTNIIYRDLQRIGWKSSEDYIPDVG